MKIISFIATALLLTACAHEPVTLPDSWAYQGDDAVTVVAAIGQATQGKFQSLMSNNEIELISAEQAEPLSIKLKHSSPLLTSMGDYKTADGRYAIIKLRLKPGQYTINAIRSATPLDASATSNERYNSSSTSDRLPVLVSDSWSYSGGANFHSEEPINLTFNFEAGKHYYLGTLTAHSLRSTRKVRPKFRRMLAKTFWVVDTKTPANQAAIIKQYPELATITLQPYSGSFTRPPYFFESIEQAQQQLMQQQAATVN